MTKLLLVDLDGTIREPISGGDFMQHPQDQRACSGSMQALSAFAEQGYKIAAISNQAGIAANHKTLGQCFEECLHTLVLFPMVERIYFCPDFQGQHLWEVDRYKKAHLSEFPQYSDLKGTFRKPQSGMILAAQRLFEPELTLYVGDREEDAAAAKNIDVSFMWANDWRKVWSEQFGGSI